MGRKDVIQMDIMETIKKSRKKSGRRIDRLWKLVLCIGLLVLVWGGYFAELNALNQRIEGVKEDDLLWVAQVERLRHEDGRFILEGFSFWLNRDTTDKAFEIVLMDMET